MCRRMCCRKCASKLIRDNVCCLDFSVAGYRGNGRLVAYRFDGEQRLDERKFVWVEASTR